MKINKSIIFVIFLTIIGILIRFYHLDYNSIWGDELFTLMFSETGILNIWSSWIKDAHPPLFYFIENLVMITLGNSDWLLRAAPAVFGILSIPLMYFVGKRFVNENVGIISAAFMTFSQYMLYYSQEARMYSMWLFFFLLSLLFFLKPKQKQSEWFLFGLVSGICLWIHFYEIPFFAILVLYALIKKEPVKNIAYSIISFVAVTFTLLPGMITILTARTSIPVWFGYQGVDVVRGVLWEIFGNYSLFAYTMLGLMFFGSLILFTKKARAILALSWFVIISGLLVSIFMSYKMPMVGRYLIVITPFIYILAATPLCYIGEIISKKINIHIGQILPIIFIILLSLPGMYVYYNTWQKEDLRGLSATISNMTNPGDRLVILTDGMVFLHYYNNTTDSTLLYPSIHVENLTRIVDNRGDNRVIILPPWDKSGYIDEMEWLKKNATQIKMKNDVEVWTVP